ncbi:hypothetical protein BCV69DRAFT_315280 [Microstroma glucosiphilum]|uniref:Uncharacterized protein n=1 Tax=Pseudomicrostroma glucosiphilum TaxID=1684307 RepID=A0A316TZP7_9BASI|nr:hypothetical protein BCV69DRAFT_315280 [Pseudomicrostroma glucosiphilum]PWN17733.1 hypothetical protein BCV69DRAFT_315280 [Pseudomicrostroma glucosiphilum]
MTTQSSSRVTAPSPTSHQHSYQHHDDCGAHIDTTLASTSSTTSIFTRGISRASTQSNSDWEWDWDGNLRTKNSGLRAESSEYGARISELRTQSSGLRIQE